MNAIDQYVAPAPPRPSPQPASTPRGPSDTSGSPTFGDVYNKAANTNQSDKDPADPRDAANTAQQPKSDDAQKPKADVKAEKEIVPGDKKPVTTATALLALTAEVKAKQTPKDDDLSVALKSNDAPETSDGKTKVADDIEKLLDKAAAKEAPAQKEAPATAAAPETDAAALALKLLGAEAALKTQDKKLQPEDTGKKDEPAKDKAEADADTKADATGQAPAPSNALAAAALAVHAAGGQAKDQHEQGKPKSEDLTAKTIAATGAQATANAATDDATKSSDVGEAVKPESLTVLDARRFVGSGEAMSPNTQAVLSGVTGDKDWAATMKAASSAANAVSEPRTATPVNTLKIQMTPESIGNVTATLRLHGDQLTVHLQVESGEAFKQLSQDKEGLIQSLKSQGFSVDQVSVQLAPAPTTDKAVAQTSTGQQAGGQMQDGSSAGQFAQQGREQDNNRRQQDNGFNANWQGDDKSVAGDPLAPASDNTARAGQVYL
ncbi:chemotaxis protein MotD [Rhizobium aquaticum]|uniref:Chemotaxis protein MotD n=1 Tax=Rhizobium aquaticum TaxID=1549636 RepID=A0ABV2J242_9HYPH